MQTGLTILCVSGPAGVLLRFVADPRACAVVCRTWAAALAALGRALGAAPGTVGDSAARQRYLVWLGVLCPMPGVSGVAPDIYRDSLCGPITFLCTPYGVPRSVTHDSVLDAIEAGALNRMPGTALLRVCVSLATKKRKRANDGAALSVIAAPCLRPDIAVKRAFAAITEDWWRWGDETDICRVGPFFVAPIMINRRLLAVHCASLQPAGGARDVQWARGLCTEGLCRAIPNCGGSDPCHLRSVTPTCAAMVVGQGRGKPLKVTVVVWWTPAAGLRVKVQRKAKRVQRGVAWRVPPWDADPTKALLCEWRGSQIV